MTNIPSKRTQSAATPPCRIKLKWLILFCIVFYILGLWIVNVGVHSNTSTSTSTISATPATVQRIESSHPDFPREPQPRPPLKSIVQGWNITGDPSWLLNLAIIGFPKTGTSTLMKYLHMSPQVHVFDEERCEMGYNQHAKLIESLYNDIPSGNFIRGIKCPRDTEIPMALQNYHKYFPKTDFMIGLRHPVHWFESFYNFRVHNLFIMPPADKLFGRCVRRHQGLCTVRGNFHLFLGNLGKTNLATDPHEQALIPKEYRKMIRPVPLQGRIFLWDISQLKPDLDTTTTAAAAAAVPHSHAQFREDLRQFLRLEEPLPEMIWVKPGVSHDRLNLNETIQQKVANSKIDICEERYGTLRAVLVQQGALAAQWIRTYFLPADGVFVSQKEYFSKVVLESWGRDPCEERRVR